MDPGEKHVGVAMWQEDELTEASEVTPRAVLGMVADFQPPLVVVEAFSLRSTRWTNAQARQAVATLKLIGGIEAICMLAGATVVEQQPSVRHVAQASPFWRSVTVPANPHIRSAVAHGLYYLHFAKR